MLAFIYGYYYGRFGSECKQTLRVIDPPKSSLVEQVQNSNKLHLISSKSIYFQLARALKRLPLSS